MLFAKKPDHPDTAISPEFKRDVAITNSLMELSPNLGDSSATESTVSLPRKSLIARPAEFDWVKNTNPFQRLRHLLTLENNWDGYGAPKFHQPQINRALELYSSINHYYISKEINFSQNSPFIAPCSDGSILFEWAGKRFPAKELEIFVPSDIDSPLEYLKSAEDIDEEKNFSIDEVTYLLDWLFTTES